MQLKEKYKIYVGKCFRHIEHPFNHSMLLYYRVLKYDYSCGMFVYKLYYRKYKAYRYSTYYCGTLCKNVKPDLFFNILKDNNAKQVTLEEYNRFVRNCEQYNKYYE